MANDDDMDLIIKLSNETPNYQELIFWTKE